MQKQDDAGVVAREEIFMPKKAAVQNTAKKSAIGASMPRHGNRSIVVGVALLRVIAGIGRPAGLGEIARAIDMTPTRTQRYLLGLARAGLVEQNPLTQRYDLGFQVVELGVLALGRTDAVRLANEVLLGLSKESNASALVIIWGTNGPTVIRSEQAELPAVIRVREGRNLSLLKSSSGRVFLTHMDDEVIQPFLKRELAELSKKQRKGAKEMVAKMRDEVREHGLARSLGEQSEHLVALSAPVFNANGTLALGLTLLNLQGRLDTDYSGRPATLLKQAAERVSARLGAGSRQTLLDLVDQTTGD